MGMREGDGRQETNDTMRQRKESQMGREDKQEKIENRHTLKQPADRKRGGRGEKADRGRQWERKRKRMSLPCFSGKLYLPRRANPMAPPTGSPALQWLLAIANLLQPFAHCSVRMFWSLPQETLSLIGFLPFTCW